MEAPVADPTNSWFSAAAFFAGYGVAVLTSAIRRKLAKRFTRRLGGPAASRGRSCDPDPPEQFIPWVEGRIQRGNGHGGPTTPKPEIIPTPQFPGGRLIRNDWGPPSRPPAPGGYYPVPRLHGEIRNPHPDSPDSP